MRGGNAFISFARSQRYHTMNNTQRVHNFWLFPRELHRATSDVTILKLNLKVSLISNQCAGVQGRVDSALPYILCAFLEMIMQRQQNQEFSHGGRSIHCLLTIDEHVLQRRPRVWIVPLLPRFSQRRWNSIGVMESATPLHTHTRAKQEQP